MNRGVLPGLTHAHLAALKDIRVSRHAQITVFPVIA
jgi:hypothetical protein